ncbi:MAG: MFS transporter [Hyphomicrobiales bacterium]|nr:MAG: MFS transporter [Hyphomicrobiales bacterium]
MSVFAPLIPLLLTAAILLAGNGLQGTLIALRAIEEGFSPTTVGLIGAAYFAGFMAASVLAPKLVQRVGHIRVFGALAATAAAGTLSLVLIPEPITWGAIRFAMGFCFSGLFTIVESWLNELSRNADRGRILSVYRMIDLFTVAGIQFLLPAVGVGGFTAFAITAILFCLSLVPVSLGDRSSPKPPEDFHFDIAGVWRLSPLACAVTFTIGMTNAAFRLLGPVYARDIGLDISGVAMFLSAGILGGGALQYPFGFLSDRFDRRVAIMVGTAGATLAGMALSFFADQGAIVVYLCSFLFGAFAMPLYSLAAAHANDRAREGQFVLIAAGLLFFYAIGASIGPIIASIVMEQFGSPAFFIYTSVMHGSLIVASIVRMAVSPAAPSERRTRFVAMLRTSPIQFRLTRRLARPGTQKDTTNASSSP